MTTLVVVVFFLAAYFPIFYGTVLIRARRLPNVVGASALLFSVIVAFVLGLRALREFGADLPEGIGVVSFTLIAAGLLAQDVALTRSSLRRRVRIVSDETSEVS